MTASLLALLLAAASPGGAAEPPGAPEPGGDALAAARTAFAAGDYGRAEALALEASGSQQPAAALYLAALARFRAGKPAEALEALERSQAGADSEAAWWFNRAACLYALGRWDEARAAFLEAARGPELAPVALANAGFAALDGGDRAGAAELARRARAAVAAAPLRGSGGPNPGPTAQLVDDLERLLRPEAPAADGSAVVAVPAAAVGSAPAAPAPVAAAAPPTPRPDRLSVRGQLLAGHDSDALLSGLGPVERPGATSARAPGAVLLAEADAAYRLPDGPWARADATYAFTQLLYGDRAAEDQSVQVHALGAAARWAPARRVALGLSLEGQLAFAGRSGFRLLQSAAGAHAWISVAEGERTATRLDAGATGKQGGRGALAALTGTRLEAGLSQEVRWQGGTLRLGYRFQREDIGEATTDAGTVAPSPLCPEGCTALLLSPLGYDGQTLWAQAQLSPFRRLELTVGAAREWRRSLADARLLLTPPAGASFTAGPYRGEDRRWFATASALWRLSDRLGLTVRWELLQREASGPAGLGVQGGGMGMGTGMGMDGGRGRTVTSAREKQVVLFGTSLAW